MASAEEFPVLCDKCLGNDTHVRMTKEPCGRHCKVCDRPFTVFRWKASKAQSLSKTAVCRTCAQVQNLCQCCVLDLQFGLPPQLRDDVLAEFEQRQVPTQKVNRDWLYERMERDEAFSKKKAEDDIDVNEALKVIGRQEQRAKEMQRKRLRQLHADKDVPPCPSFCTPLCIHLQRRDLPYQVEADRELKFSEMARQRDKFHAPTAAQKVHAQQEQQEKLVHEQAALQQGFAPVTTSQLRRQAKQLQEQRTVLPENADFSLPPPPGLSTAVAVTTGKTEAQKMQYRSQRPNAHTARLHSLADLNS
ncbi:MAG: hypothetical protein MHM6MM_004668 [Cercozoa sp. M6MM]